MQEMFEHVYFLKFGLYIRSVETWNHVLQERESKVHFWGDRDPVDPDTFSHGQLRGF